VEKKNFLITKKNVAAYSKKIAKFIASYVKGAGKDGIVLGVSGGIDSALTARLVQESGVPLTVVLILDREEMFQSGGVEHSRELITKFKMDFRVLTIKNACAVLEVGAGEALNPVTRQALRPRLRMSLLYAIAQNNNWLVAGSTNLCECTVGYFTKFGDGASDFNPLGMLTKGEIRILAEHLGVPGDIINKAPSADEFIGQTDEADLGFTYEQLDNYILNGSSGDKKVDALIVRREKANKHKVIAIPFFNE